MSAVNFSAREYQKRMHQTQQSLNHQNLDALLCFRQESMYWLTGYDTFGYVFFQCLVVTSDGRVTLLTRAPDLRQAQLTSNINDIRIWIDHPNVNPADNLKSILKEMGLENKRLGVEYEAYGLTARNGKRLEESLNGFASLIDASSLISRLRVIKSNEEIEYVKKAGQLADDALEAAYPKVYSGAFEGDILASMQGAIFSGGGDYSGNEFIIGSGENALLCRYQTNRRHLKTHDQLTLEWAGVYRRYHAAMMRTLLIGEVDPFHRRLSNVAQKALQAVENNFKPGNTFHDAFMAHAKILDQAGLSKHRLNACGYSLGTTFAPNWMDWPMLHEGNEIEIKPGMTLFCHIIIVDSDTKKAMSLGRTSLITPNGSESLSKLPLHVEMN